MKPWFVTARLTDVSLHRCILSGQRTPWGHGSFTRASLHGCDKALSRCLQLSQWPCYTLLLVSPLNPSLCLFYKVVTAIVSFFELAATADHPLLTAQSMALPEPKQRPNQSLVAYVWAWVHFMKQPLLVGIVYADRYFIDCVMACMNAALRAQLEPEIVDRRNMVGYGDPVPDALQPNALLSTLRQHAVALGHPEYLSLSPRALLEASQLVRAVVKDPDFTIDASVHAIGSTLLYLLCSNPSHFLWDCPFLGKLQDPAVRRAIGLPNIHSAVRQVWDIASDNTTSTLHSNSPDDTYIQRMLQSHGWETPGVHESDRHDSVPLSPNSASRLQEIVGPPEHTPEHLVIERRVGFNYRQVLGEIMYAYVICRADIGFAVTLLARYSQNPALEHYHALKTVVKYLRRTRDWGLMYWRCSPNLGFPHVAYDPVVVDPALPSYPAVDQSQLTGFVNASHAVELSTRRSVTGLDFMFAGAVFAYKSKVQPTVSTSSTKAEFIASVYAAKTAKYLQSILTDLGFPPTGPTQIHIDNQAAIAMVNEDRPTSRARHIDVQWFAIQKWRRSGLIRLTHIPGIINPADQHTKALAAALHHCHSRRLMGHYGCFPTSCTTSETLFPAASKPGRVLVHESSHV